jgi:membrane associated rhomboid family serine protease/Flp pilus assembly protein TadD
MANCTQCGRKLPAFSFQKICEWCVRHEAAKRGEEPEDAIQPVMPVPWAAGDSSSVIVTQALFGINIAVFAAMALQGIAMDPNSQQLIHWGANYGPLTLGGQPWRLLTSTFVHIGLLHIFFNMWCLWDLGAMCESLYGHWTFAAVYLISGVAASLTSVWWRPVGVSAGASGAIFGIVGALIASHYLGEFSAPRFAVRSRLRSVVTFAGYALLFGAVSGRTDNAAHIGGLVTGLIFGALIARGAPERDALPRIVVVLCVSLVVLGAAAWLHRSRSYLIHAQRGDALVNENKPDEGAAELQLSIRQHPDYLPAHFGLAHAYFDKGQFSEAEAELNRVLQLQPGHAGAKYELGMVYLHQGRIADAKGEFTELLRTDKNDAYAHFGLGMALAAEENHQGAVQEFKTAAQIQPDFSSAFYKIGLEETKLKQYDEAIADFRKQVENWGDDYATETALADAYQAKGMLNEAKAALEKAGKLKAGK